MASAPAQPCWTLEGFLAWEAEQTERHEFVRGEVFAMVGARRIHARTVQNIARLIGNALEGGPCQTFAAAAKVAVADDTVLYPDVFVTCDRLDLRTDILFRAPLLVVEVLSPSTEAFDRGQKFALYRSLPSLREYVLVDPETKAIERYRLIGAGEWHFSAVAEGESLRLDSLPIELDRSRIFDGVDPPQDD